MKIFTKNWFTKKIKIAVNLAGPRYSPKVNVKLPATELFDGLGRTTEFYLQFRELKEEIKKKWGESSLKRDFDLYPLLKNKKRILFQNLAQINSFLEKIEESKFETIDFTILKKSYDRASKKLISVDSDLRKSAGKKDIKRDLESPPPSTKDDRMKWLIHEIREIEEVIYRLYNLTNSNSSRATNKRAVLLLGEAGIGKTHLLCDIAEKQIQNNMPTILILGQQLSFFEDPLEAIIGELGLSLSKKQFLGQLNNMAKRKNQRVLILIDAINEGDREGWNKHFSSFLQEVLSYPGLAIALSCRTPFDKITVPKRAKILRVFHHGFKEHELDALKIYTSFYKLPLPELPLLTPEFTNPLFLKLFCVSLADATVKKRHKQIKEISSGQKGMTNIFEDIVIAKSKKIAKDFGCSTKIIWKIVKEDIASKMAISRQGWIYLDYMIAILSKYFCKKRVQKIFLSKLISENLLSEDMYFDQKNKRYFEIVRFPYQKFSDHIISRHLLANYFNKNKIKESFKDANLLGWLFQSEHAIWQNAGLIEAIIIELPNRIQNRGELFDFLSVDITNNLSELFLNGLYWRDANCFNKSTKKWLNTLLKNSYFRNKTLDVLLALSTKPNHPYSALILDNYLKQFKMAQRDLFWSEFLRKRDESDTPYKLLNWIEKSHIRDISEEHAKMYTVILKWFLTSTNRSFRDRATRALYYIGKQNPWLLFGASLEALALNDPCIPERMLAASYGVVMALHYDSPICNFNEKHLKIFAINLFKLMFARKAKFGTTHILMRDYAKHIIDIALIHNKKMLSKKQRELVTPPFKYGGIRKWIQSVDLDKEKYKNGSSPMHMDFENYTLGRLVNDRSNYDFKHNEYQKVRANVFWRIYDLGYTHDLFKDVDSEIGQYNWRLNRSEHIKVDRYGKKYSWIAFFELAGYRQDNNLLPKRYESRISDTDIDPSFPEGPVEKQIIKKNYLGDQTIAVTDWIEQGAVPDVTPYLHLKKIANYKGSWILLDGFFSQENLEINRNLFIFLRGFFVSNKRKKSLLKALGVLECPNNNILPEIEADYCTFAGEIPWCETFPYVQYKKRIEIPTGKKYMYREKIKKPVKTIKVKLDEKTLELLGFGYNKTDIDRGFREWEKERILRFSVEVPVRKFSWESGRSVVNSGASAYVPAKEICEHCKLSSRPQTFNMFDYKGKIASISCQVGDLWHWGQKLIYLRKDLLDEYLNKKEKSLVWVIWGERSFRSKNEKELQTFALKHTAYKTYKYIVIYN